MIWRVAAAVGLLTGVLALPVSAATPPSSVRIQDDRINESSALVDLGSVWVTTNDSGDSARVFTIDPVSGGTVGVTNYHAKVSDVEALAPGGGNAVWVGDIGDNNRSRKSVVVYRVPVGRGRIDAHPGPIRLAYPRSRPNAESLFADRGGRLYVVTKAVTGGIVYRAPARLNVTKVNRLQPVARLREYATDAALTRDGQHVIVRGPEIAGIYALPSFERVGSFRLPLQPQGEGISVGPDGQVRVSSEGGHTAIRAVTVPADLATVIGAPVPTPPPTATPSPSPSPTPSPQPSPSPSPTPASSPSTDSGSSSSGFGGIDPPWLVWFIPAVIGIGALGIGLGLRRRSE
jgi:hypothetical protein